MLHILLMILKIIGITLLVILGIILVLLLLVLFVPVRYNVDARKDEKLTADVTVSWLLHIVTGKYKYCEEPYYYAKVFGIKVFPKKEKPKKNKDVKKKKQKKKLQEEADETNKIPTDSDSQKTRLKTAIEQTKEVAKREEEEEAKKPKSLKERIQGIISSVRKKISDIISKVKNIIESIKTFFSTLSEKIKFYFEMLMDESNRAAIKFAWDILKDLIVHILPKKHKIEVVYGNSDPAKLADIIGYVAMFKSATDMNLKFTPDFTRDVIEGRIRLKGRLQIFFVLVLALKVYKNKDIRKLLDNFTK